MNRTMIFGLILGLSAFIAMIVYYGAADILQATAAIGWGVLVVCVFRFGLLIFDTLSWWALLGRTPYHRLGGLFWMRWVGDSVNTLLPVARIGGELIRARLLAMRGVGGAVAGASVIVDVTAGIFTQFLFSVVGVVAFVAFVQVAADDLVGLVAGLALFGLGLAVFYYIQKSGAFLKIARLMEKIAQGKDWTRVTGGAAALDDAVMAMYRSRGAFIHCSFWRIIGWVAGTAEVWLILYFLGHPISWTEAFILESLVQAARSAGFLVPGGLGVQEGGFILVGAQLGLTPEIALALSLIKRVRELAIGVPGLIAWQITEGKQALNRNVKET